MVQWLIGIGVVVLAIPVVVWASHRMLTTAHADGSAGSGGADAFGGLVDIFEPARARASRDLESHHTLRQEAPTPGKDPGSTIDQGHIRIKRPNDG